MRRFSTTLGTSRKLIVALLDAFNENNSAAIKVCKEFVEDGLYTLELSVNRTFTASSKFDDFLVAVIKKLQSTVQRSRFN